MILRVVGLWLLGSVLLIGTTEAKATAQPISTPDTPYVVVLGIAQDGGHPQPLRGRRGSGGGAHDFVGSACRLTAVKRVEVVTCRR